ncbi:MAG: TlpA family protein disulfide reductase, partial [Alphaproteobacteria bacterium]|nr:TlpA family protein disulfide reductase [Alphaproteobacteria bacterium]
MDRKILSLKFKTLLTAACVAVAACAIVVISAPKARADGATANAPHALLEKLTSAEVDAAAFDTPFFTAEKAEITLNGRRGRGAVVNFWATWCVPCVREMPSFDRLTVLLKDSGVDMIAVSTDRKPEKVPSFLAKILNQSISECLLVLII